MFRAQALPGMESSAEPATVHRFMGEPLYRRAETGRGSPWAAGVPLVPIFRVVAVAGGSCACVACDACQ